MIPIEAVLLGFLLIAAVAVCVMRRLLASVIIFTSFSIVMSVLWILLAAPDLAITEAAVGTGISGVLFFVVLRRIQVMEKEYREEEGRLHRRKRKPGGWRQFLRLFYNTLSVIVCLGITSVLLFTTSKLPAFGNPGNPANNEVSKRYIEYGVQDTGAVNIVASMILDYRAFDTFGETCVLFAAVCAILVLLRRDSPIDIFDVFLLEMEEPRQNIILKNMAFPLVAVILIFGCYVVLNGHLSPGGGFSGGAILGAALVLYASAYGTVRARNFINYKVYCRIVSICLAFYALAKGYSIYIGANHIASVIPFGAPGSLLSAGMIPLLNIAVGLIVACTVYIIYILFSKGELQ